MAEDFCSIRGHTQIPIGYTGTQNQKGPLTRPEATPAARYPVPSSNRDPTQSLATLARRPERKQKPGNKNTHPTKSISEIST